MAFLGVDQSLNGTGVCVLADDGTLLTLLTISQDARQGDARLLNIRQRVDAHVSNVRFAAMEGYAYNSTNRAFALGEVGGTVKVLFLERAVPFVVVPPVTLKMFATGSTAAEKDDMVAAACVLGAAPADDNQADAFHLAQLARAHILGTAKKRHEMEALHSLRTSISGKQHKPARRIRRFVKNAI